MEEFKPKRKNTAQPAQNGQSAPHTRKPRTPKPQGENCLLYTSDAADEL